MLGKGTPPSIQTQDHIMERGASFKGYKPPRHCPFIYKTELQVSQMAVVRIVDHISKHLVQNGLQGMVATTINHGLSSLQLTAIKA